MSYFNFKRKKLATEVLKICHECAEKAGIRHAMFINYGLLLGIIRENDYIPWDNDVDVCIKSDLISAAQEIKYYKLLKKATKGAPKGLFSARDKWSVVKDPEGFSETLINSEKYEWTSDSVTKKQPRKVRFTWFSLRKKPEYPKFCHWFMFPWNGCYWHTKAGQWVKDRKFSVRRFKYDKSDQAILKGIPEDFLKELIKINFYGLDIQIPLKYGSCLDFMYPGWRVPRQKGASSKKIVCIAKKWNDRKTWKMVLA